MINPNFRSRDKDDHQSLYFDIGLIIMQSKVNGKEGFIPICLPNIPIKNPSSLTNQALTIIGYGLNDKDQVGTDLLTETVTVRENEYCNKAHLNAGQDQERIKAALPELFINSLFCAEQDLDRKVGPCNGDSGSPAFQRIFKEDDRFFVQGIVSGTIQCKSDRYPNFFTLVASSDILPWVKKEVFDHEIDNGVLFNFPNKELSNIPCFEDIDCPKNHDFTCSSNTGNCLKSPSTSSLYIDVASKECPNESPCFIRGFCHEPECNRHGICWCSAFQQTASKEVTSSLEENECSGRQCQDDCECPNCTPYCIKVGIWK